MAKSVLILGAGGHAKVLIEILKQTGTPIIGITAPHNVENGRHLMDIPIIGDDEEVLKFQPADIDLVNGIGSVAENRIRRAVFERFTSLGYSFPPLVHPSAVIASDATLYEGAQIMAGAIIQPDSTIGRNAIVNTKASVDHDCIIGDHVHIAPGATISGTVTIGSNVHVGTGATIINNVVIGTDSFIAAGAVVTRSIANGVKVRGVPAKEVPL
ncbi:sugar acetyltransferase [Bacillus sp. FJAT-27225]|uniref:acetyltransferase n=1 Tax=Bacillus sp. FJAT-27225 TaxID=1743144 RepID=UPI00080C232E|nr:acetyltransferase [Bacillus sp. FJAT-27225]OCA87868.1 sugar acetyltransferase [Bacillus sp. FJAT-27225]